MGPLGHRSRRSRDRGRRPGRPATAPWRPVDRLGQAVGAHREPDGERLRQDDQLGAQAGGLGHHRDRAGPAWRRGPPTRCRAGRRRARTVTLGSDAAQGAEAEAVGAVGVLGLGPHPAVELHGVGTDEDAPPPGRHAVEDDGGRVGRGHRRALAEHGRRRSPRARGWRRRTSRPSGCPAVRAWPRKSAAASSTGLVPGVDLLAVDHDVGADVAGHHHRHLHVGRVHAEVLDQRLGEPLHRELRRAVGRVRDARAERGPEAVHAARVHEVAGVAGHQQRHEGPRRSCRRRPSRCRRCGPTRTGRR